MLVSSSIASLIQGVSQQPTTLRLPTQAEAQVNCYPSIVDGLQKRQPTEHLVKAINGDAGDVQVHYINRDSAERYAVLLRNADIQVVDLLTGDLVPVHSADAPYTPDFTYVTVDPAELRALTVADFTFVLNRTKTAALEAATSAASQSATKAFVFVKRGAYKSNYRVAVQRNGGDWRTAVISTWDGTAAAASQEVHSVTITAVGAVAGLWTIGFAGGVNATYTVLPGDTLSTVAAGLRAAVNAVGLVGTSNVTAWGAGNGMSIIAEKNNVDIGVLTVTPPAGGAANTTQEIIHTALELASIKTDVIAGELASIISAFPGFTAAATGSIVRVTTTTTLDYLETQDSGSDELLGTIWKSVESISELPLTCEDGYTITVKGSTDDEADDYYVEFIAEASGEFGNGRWEETIGPGLEYELDVDTMPWQLVRKQDDGLGTVTGTPNAKYFEWGPVEWEDRLVGDDETNPAPSFVGETLSDIFFHRNRLGLLAGQNVILSEAARYFSFWRTTVVTLVDSDPIDVAAAHGNVSNLHAALPFDRRLILFSDRTQFVLQGEPLLTPKTASITPTLEFENYKDVRPLSTGRTLMFAFRRGSYSGVREMFPLDEEQNFEQDDITAHIPRYIDGMLTEMVGSTLEDIVVCRADGDLGTIYVYKYFWSNQNKLQSAWSTYTFGPGAEVVGCGFIDNTLYLAIQRTEGLFIESMTIAPGQTDANADYITYLDRRITDAGLVRVYDLPTNRTTITLPYSIEAGAEMQVVTRCTAPNNGGEVLTILSTGPSSIVVQGDHSADALWIGQQYTASYEFTKFRMTEQTERGRGTVTAGRLQLRFGSVTYDSTGAFSIVVTPVNRDPYTYVFGRVLGAGDLLGEVVLSAGTFRFPLIGLASEVSVVIQNDTPFPSNIQSAEWEATFYSKSTRVSGS